MARARRAIGRISPTHAWEILFTETPYPYVAGLIPPVVADWIEAALHNGDCHIWRDGKLVSKAEAKHLLVLANGRRDDDERDIIWWVTIRDDRGGPPREEGYEFDADEIRALLPGAEVPRQSSVELPEPEPRRRRVSRLEEMRREGFFKKSGTQQKRAIAWALDEYPPDGNIPASLTSPEIAEKIQQWRMRKEKPRARLAEEPLQRFCRRFLKDYRQKP